MSHDLLKLPHYSMNSRTKNKRKYTITLNILQLVGDICNRLC